MRHSVVFPFDRPGMQKKIILLELNEVPKRVLQSFATDNPSSAFAKVINCGTSFETFTPDDGHLSPWITWPTLHRGVSNALHGLTSFGQSLDVADGKYPPIWKLLAQHGVSTGVFGSLHSYPMPAMDESNYFYVPDTFASSPECHPKKVSHFQAFNLAMVGESARNVSTKIPATALAFLPKAFSLGLTFRTAFKICQQLLAERVSPWKRNRRRSLQAVLCFDVFMKLMKSKQPQFATFFTNHVASSMHRFWAAKYPQDFATSDFDNDWQKRYEGEIAWAMNIADDLVESLMQFCDRRKDTILVIASSMGQAAHDARKVSRQLVLSDPAKFVHELGVPAGCWEKRPAMVPQFNCVVASSHADAFEQELRALTLNGQPVEFIRQAEGFFSISFGQINLADDNCVLKRHDAAVALHGLGLTNLEIEDEAGSTGYHIPEGIMLVYDPGKKTAATVETPIPTTDIAPAICGFFDIPNQPYMSRGGGFADVIHRQ